MLTQKPQARVAELVRRAGLKIQWWQHRVGSTPTLGTHMTQNKTSPELIGAGFVYSPSIFSSITFSISSPDISPGCTVCA